MRPRKKSVVSNQAEVVAKENEDNLRDNNKQSKLNKVFENLSGFQLDDLTSFEKFVKLLYRPTDASSLGVVRALFGLCMVIDIVHERGLSDIDKKWGNPLDCRFPLIHGMVLPPLHMLTILYTVMWLGAFGIMLGYNFRFSCFCYVASYWYLFLLDTTFWNNHSYLYGIVATLFWGTGANSYFSLDALMKERDKKVPLWNYFILRFQFFLLYFLAGLKKTDPDWLGGYSVETLTGHWVFAPFSIIFTPEQTNFFIVHWFGFIFDLTIGFFLIFDKTRKPAMIFCSAFHLMNSRLFSIGMFPYTCLATMPIFCHVEWPKKFEKIVKFCFTLHIFHLFNIGGLNREEENVEINNAAETSSTTKSEDLPEPETDQKDEEEKDKKILAEKKLQENRKKKASKKQKFVVSLILVHIGLQFFLPYSHFITKGYNNWVPGLYGYSWNMMINYWDSVSIVVQVRDNTNNEDFYIHPIAYAGNNKWWSHGDRVKKYAHCLKRNLMMRKKEALSSSKPMKDKEQWAKLSSNISIYVDVWCSLNGRFKQRMFKSGVDMLTAEWHPFKPVSFLVPLLTNLSSHRYKIREIKEEVYSWSNYSGVLLMADYPGMKKLHFVNDDLVNVSLSVIEGEVEYTEEGTEKNITIPTEGSLSIPSGRFHEVRVVSSIPACYMYTFVNGTKQYLKANRADDSSEILYRPPTIERMIQEIIDNIEAWTRALNHIKAAFFFHFFHNPFF